MTSTAIIFLTYYLQVTERILRSIQTDMYIYEITAEESARNNNYLKQKEL